VPLARSPAGPLDRGDVAVYTGRRNCGDCRGIHHLAARWRKGPQKTGFSRPVPLRVFLNSRVLSNQRRRPRSASIDLPPPGAHRFNLRASTANPHPEFALVKRRPLDERGGPDRHFSRLENRAASRRDRPRRVGNPPGSDDDRFSDTLRCFNRYHSETRKMFVRYPLNVLGRPRPFLCPRSPSADETFPLVIVPHEAHAESDRDAFTVTWPGFQSPWFTPLFSPSTDTGECYATLFLCPSSECVGFAEITRLAGRPPLQP